MLLVFGDDGTNLDIPDLLTQRLPVAPAKSLAAATASIRFAGDDLLTVDGRDQRPFKLLMSTLSTPFAFRLRLLLRRRFRRRMFARRRLGRIARVLCQFRFEFLDAFFQLCDSQQQNLDKRLHRRRHFVEQFGRNVGHP